MIKAVIFDMDGLLFDTERASFGAFLTASTRRGWQVPESLPLSCIGTTAARTEEIIISAMGPDFPLGEIQKETAQILESEFAGQGPPLKSGVFSFLQTVMRKGCRRGVASSTRKKTVLKHLEKTALYPFFQSIIGGDEIEFGKPDPEIYRRSADNLGVVPEECLVFEDSEAGLRAAQGAGMRTVWVPDLQRVDPAVQERCFRVVESLDEAMGLWNQLAE